MPASGPYSATIRLNGSPLIETVCRDLDGDGSSNVQLPFNSEYEIGLYNGTDRRAIAHIAIDGIKVTGGGLVIPSFGGVNLDCPVEGDKNHFKFVSEKSHDAYLHGKGVGQGADKGIVRVAFDEEIIPKPVLRFSGIHSEDLMNSFGGTCIGRGMTNCCSTGATVSGSKSSTTFSTVHFNSKPTSHFVVFHLSGYDSFIPGFNNVVYSDANCPCGQTRNRLSNRCLRCGRDQ